MHGKLPSAVSQQTSIVIIDYVTRSLTIIRAIFITVNFDNPVGLKGTLNYGAGCVKNNAERNGANYETRLRLGSKRAAH